MLSSIIESMMVANTTIKQAVDTAKEINGNVDPGSHNHHGTILHAELRIIGASSDHLDFVFPINDGETGSNPDTGDDGTTNWDFIIPVTHLKTVPAGYKGIYTAQDLDNIRNNRSGKYILMNDIDLSSWGEWTPIGGTVYRYNHFQGV